MRAAPAAGRAGARSSLGRLLRTEAAERDAEADGSTDEEWETQPLVPRPQRPPLPGRGLLGAGAQGDPSSPRRGPRAGPPMAAGTTVLAGGLLISGACASLGRWALLPPHGQRAEATLRNAMEAASSSNTSSIAGATWTFDPSVGCSNWESILDFSAVEPTDEACGRRCLGRHGCVGFGFQKSDCPITRGNVKGMCYLWNAACEPEGNDCWDGFSLQGGGAARRPAEDAIEAPSPPPPGAVAPPPPPPPVGAAPPPPPPPEAIPKGYACQPGRRYTGQAWGVLLTEPVSSLEDCAAACDGVDDCSIFVYDVDVGQCFLKSHYTNSTLAVGDRAAVSCAKQVVEGAGEPKRSRRAGEGAAAAEGAEGSATPAAADAAQLGAAELGAVSPGAAAPAAAAAPGGPNMPAASEAAALCTRPLALEEREAHVCPGGLADCQPLGSPELCASRAAAPNGTGQGPCCMWTEAVFFEIRSGFCHDHPRGHRIVDAQLCNQAMRAVGHGETSVEENNGKCDAGCPTGCGWFSGGGRAGAALNTGETLDREPCGPSYTCVCYRVTTAVSM